MGDRDIAYDLPGIYSHLENAHAELEEALSSIDTNRTRQYHLLLRNLHAMVGTGLREIEADPELQRARIWMQENNV